MPPPLDHHISATSLPPPASCIRPRPHRLRHRAGKCVCSECRIPRCNGTGPRGNSSLQRSPANICIAPWHTPIPPTSPRRRSGLNSRRKPPSAPIAWGFALLNLGPASPGPRGAVASRAVHFIDTRLSIFCHLQHAQFAAGRNYQCPSTVKRF